MERRQPERRVGRAARARPGAAGRAGRRAQLGSARAGRGTDVHGRADVRQRLGADPRTGCSARGRRERIAAELAEDPLVATLLLIHDLHPVPLHHRVQDALDSVRPYMDSHGGDVELLSLDDGVARIRLRGSCSDCSASSVTLELAIKQALDEAAPDLEGLEVEGVAPQMPGLGLPMAGNGTELPMAANASELPIVISGQVPTAPPRCPAVLVRARRRRRAGRGVDRRGQRRWQRAGGGERRRNAAGLSRRLRELRRPAARRRPCLGRARCPRCERSFFLPRAGRSLDDDHLQLEPVPLLREQGRVKVALAG